MFAIVVPCYNEQEALPLSVPVLSGILERAVGEGLVSDKSFLLLCDDGSTDATWRVIKDFHSADSRVKGMALASNRGHQNVLMAGLECARAHGAEVFVSIDADLQDDPEKILEMLRLYRDGYEIVFGVRADRRSDSGFKRNTAKAFYSLQRMLGVKTIADHADFRLMSRRAVDMLLDYGEANLYLRGIVSQLGLRTAVVSYARKAREAGRTHYPLHRMLSLGVDGITSFTAKPMRMIFYVGMILLVLDIGMAIYILGSYLNHAVISGWTSIMLSLWFLGSLILMALGIIGEYIGKIYIESKHRPRYSVADELFD